MEIRAATEEEQKYTHEQSMQIQGQTGCIGCMKGSFEGPEDGPHTEWSDEWERYKTEGFEAERDTVMEALRTGENGLLSSLSSMKSYMKKHPEGSIHGSRGREAAFRVDTEKHAYLIRCCAGNGGGGFTCYCYVGKWLDSHIEKAAKGIRFIDPHYNELFRIRDGEKIVVTSSWGEKTEHTCRYIDEYHTEVGNNIFHICEFAERMHTNGAAYEPKQEEAAAKRMAMAR